MANDIGVATITVVQSVQNALASIRRMCPETSSSAAGLRSILDVNLDATQLLIGMITGCVFEMTAR